MDDLAQVIVEFNTKASTIFLSHYNEFIHTVEKLDRKKDENIFQLQQNRYLETLKNRLEYLAQSILNKYESMRGASLLYKKLTDEISQLLNEFRQRSSSL